MNNNASATSSSRFIGSLSALERDIFDQFTSCQRIPGAGTLCVFQPAFGNGKTANVMAVPVDSPLAKHIEWNMKQDDNRYNLLLMALDLRRSFETQWPLVPGQLKTLERFVMRPLICARGLENAQFIDQHSTMGDGLRRSRLTMVSNTDQPRVQPASDKQKPKFTIYPGFRP